LNNCLRYDAKNSTCIQELMDLVNCMQPIRKLTNERTVKKTLKNLTKSNNPLRQSESSH